MGILVYLVVLFLLFRITLKPSKNITLSGIPDVYDLNKIFWWVILAFFIIIYTLIYLAI